MLILEPLSLLSPTTILIGPAIAPRMLTPTLFAPERRSPIIMPKEKKETYQVWALVDLLWRPTSTITYNDHSLLWIATSKRRARVFGWDGTSWGNEDWRWWEEDERWWLRRVDGHFPEHEPTPKRWSKPIFDVPMLIFCPDGIKSTEGLLRKMMDDARGIENSQTIAEQPTQLQHERRP
jgi:hypothetical protein